MASPGSQRTVVSARDVAYDYLQGEVVSGRLAPGEAIDDAAVARDLGVSRTPVREALIQLQQDGLIDSSPRRRLRVAEAEAPDAQLVIAPLGVLQVLAAEVAVARATPADIVELRKHNDRLLAAIEAGDVDAAQQADIDFHGVLVRLADNRFLAAEIANLETHLRRLSALYFRNRAPDQRSAAEHEEIIAAVAARDVAKAAAATRSNYLRGLDILGSSEAARG